MTDYVRVRDNDTGHHLSVPAEAVKNNPSAYSVLKQDAVDRAGRPLPPKFKSPSPSTSSQQSEQKKEA